jgi:hypothetical protein
LRCAERAIAIGLSERFDLYRFQCDLLRQHDVPDSQVALWTEPPLVDHIAAGISSSMFMDLPYLMRYLLPVSDPTT